MAVHKAFFCQIYLDMKDVFLLLCQTHPLYTPTSKSGIFLKTNRREGGEGMADILEAIEDN